MAQPPSGADSGDQDNTLPFPESLSRLAYRWRYSGMPSMLTARVAMRESLRWKERAWCSGIGHALKARSRLPDPSDR